MEKKRLLKLADFLDKLPRKKFDFSNVVVGPDEPRKDLGCGSMACAIGWCPVVFPKLAYYGKPKHSDWGGPTKRFVHVRGKQYKRFSLVVQQLFGVSETEARALFIPGHQDDIGYKDLGDDATPKQVAAMIRRFVAKKDKATSDR